MNRRLISILSTLIAIVAALPLVAQDVVPPRFFIERIDVRNAKRVSVDVISAELRLRAGQEYSEADMRDAAARLTRLPFLLSADFSLEKGSERGKHVLVISVVETKGFFYLLDFRPIFDNDNAVRRDYGDNLIGGDGSNAAVGYRWFLGRRGSLHVGMLIQSDNRQYTSDYSAVAVGWTQYDLFGTRAFATLNLKQTLGSELGGISPQLVVGVPFSVNQTVTLTYDEAQVDETSNVSFNGSQLNETESQRLISAQWSYNTSNHPFLPTAGTVLTVTPLAVWRDDRQLRFINDPEMPLPPLPFVARRHLVARHDHSLGIDATARRYWELSDRNSVSAGFEGGWAKTSVRNNPGDDRSFNSHRAIVSAGYSRSLWGRERVAVDGDSRLEFVFRAGVRTSEHLEFETFEDDAFQQATFAWVRRNAWGTLRLGAGYAW